MRGKILAVNISDKKGMRKTNVGSCRALKDFGLEADGHAGPWHRQVSLLANESIEKMRRMGLNVGFGDFAENLTTEGMDLVGLPIGTVIRVGGSVVLRVTQIGKVCHERCAIYYQAGDCVMPREGIFAEVLAEGEIKVGDEIVVQEGEREEACRVLTGPKPPFKVAVLTVSDRGSTGERQDASGPLIREMIQDLPAEVVHSEIIPDEQERIVEALKRSADTLGADLILTTGGTGMSPRDVTPDATLKVIERPAPGLCEAMRAEGLKQTPHAMISRAVSGIRGSTLIVNLPGSPKGVRENLGVILPALPHALAKLKGDPTDCGQP